jgi:serine-type D-Ala-D-Ala endopeptidase (penicillin-binding protein 7)
MTPTHAPHAQILLTRSRRARWPAPGHRMRAIMTALLCSVFSLSLLFTPHVEASNKKPAPQKREVKKPAPSSTAKRSTKAEPKLAGQPTSKTSSKAVAKAGTKTATAKASLKGKASASSSARKRDNMVAQRVVVRGKNGKRTVVTRYVPRVIEPRVVELPRPSFGQLAGLHQTQDPLDLKSSVAFVVDQDTQEVLFHKNETAVLPIASLTKLMTAVIVSEARLDMNELITITQEEIDTEKGTRSRLAIGTTLTRGELMRLALMSSENRAAHALGRTYPGGASAFVQAMNAKARLLGMADTRYVEPTGLSSRNQSSAKDLATLAAYASNDRLVRELSVSDGMQVDVGARTINYVNTNRLVRNPEWEIGLQKTGFISEAGHTLVMQTKVAGRRLIMVFLDSVGKLSRLGDAERVRKWVETQPTGTPQKISDSAQLPRSKS